MTSPRIVSSAEAAKLGAERIGGKAAGLASLDDAGVATAPWFAITSALGRDLLAEVRPLLVAASGIDAADSAAIRALSARVRQSVTPAKIPPRDVASLLAHFDASFSSDALVAVRSSAIDEDSAKDSFAGQLDTYLFVSRERLVERVVACFASAFTERAIAYRLLRRRPLADVDAAVVVQRMIDSVTSGVLFTANPTTRDTSEMVVSAAFGLGEGVVAGTVDTDTFYCSHDGTTRSKLLVKKVQRVVFDKSGGGGTTLEDVPADEQQRATLDAEQLRALCALAKRVEAARGGPQDIEWAIDRAGAMYLLQARPITTLLLEHEEIFDNANIVESYPGLSSPLTFSVARAGYEATFREFHRIVGVPAEIISRNQDIYANLVALVDGRIYYQLLQWYRSMQTVPGFEWAIPGWEKALGLKRRYHPPVERSLGQKLRAGPAVARIYLTFLRRAFDLPRHAEAYLRTLAEVQTEVDRRLAAGADAHGLLELVHECHRRLMPPYAISVINDSFAQQHHEAVGKLIERFGLGDPATLRNELLCGEAGMESVEPVRSALALAENVRRDDELRALFVSAASDAAVWSELTKNPAHSEFRRQVDEHMTRFGDRTLHELKLETASVREDPEFLVRMLRNYVAGGQQIEAMEVREKEIRRRAEAAVDAGLRGHPVRAATFRLALRKLREAVKWRENLRLARTRAFGLLKRIYREMGNRFTAAGLLDERADIFFLTEQEIEGAVRGTTVTRDLRSLVALRKREYAELARRTPPSRVVTNGIAVASARRADEEMHEVSAGTSLQGIGCSPGRVTGPAKIVRDPSDDLRIDGEVLVAPMTDPGWVFLMVAAKALVSERGSLLSHTAIIGRELGIPTVVGVPDATRRIRGGQQVTVDGAAGLVTLHEE